jgi:hypothetical protein
MICPLFPSFDGVAFELKGKPQRKVLYDIPSPSQFLEFLEKFKDPPAGKHRNDVVKYLDHAPILAECRQKGALAGERAAERV